LKVFLGGKTHLKKCLSYHRPGIEISQAKSAKGKWKNRDGNGVGWKNEDKAYAGSAINYNANPPLRSQQRWLQNGH